MPGPDAQPNGDERDPAAVLALARGGDLDAAARALAIVGSAVRAEIAAKIPARFQSALEADDVMQVSYLEALLGFSESAFTGSDPAALRAWLRTIAEHNLTDAIRGLSRQKRPDPGRRVSDPGSDASLAGRPAEDLIQQLLITSKTPSRVAAAHEAEALLLRAIDALPDDYALVVRMIDLERLPVDEVAARMERSVGAIHMLRLRARERLRIELGRSSQYFTEADG